MGCYDSTMDFIFKNVARVLYLVYTLIGFLLVVSAGYSVYQAEGPTVTGGLLIGIGIFIMLIGVGAICALSKNTWWLMVIINFLNFVLLVTLFVATVIAFMVTYSVKDPVKASLEKSWPKVGPTFIDYCHNKAIAAGEIGTCTTYTSPFKLVNLTTNKEINEKRAAEVCDGKCRTTLITEAQDKQAIMRYAAWALTILLFVHFMYNTFMKMKTGELAVTEVDEFGLTGKTLVCSGKIAVVLNAILMVLGILVISLGMYFMFDKDGSVWSWTSTWLMIVGGAVAVVSLLSIICICMGNAHIFGRIYMLCNWIMVILGVLMLLFAFTTSFTGNVINTVNTEFDNNWEQLRNSFELHNPVMYKQLCPVLNSSLASNSTAPSSSGRRRLAGSGSGTGSGSGARSNGTPGPTLSPKASQCKEKVREQLKANQSVVGIFCMAVLGYMWALIYMTNGTIKTLRLAPDSNGSYEGVAELDELATS